MNVTAPDLATTPQRSGRTMLGRFAWLARLADKVRADHAGTEGDYVAYCGLSTGFLDRAGVSVEGFDKLIADVGSDADLTRYFDAHVSDAQREAANRFVLDDMKSHPDEQDAEEAAPKIVSFIRPRNAISALTRRSALLNRQRNRHLCGADV
ncbi:MAG: DUF5069 domain-containing protein [Candidatus Eremiobacteraeota bacterium]|nr:DUF5069 domain-containing protein [Candidatus Eremiobacteraeota bacterium]MBC5802068.1 DUF5069 domain-containing protein [Candidatus Eremiobacteraeota bacterium]MBC5822694.1 DUF5069 domain-containing protein [Candidatus Eremiobacteraeota bacterium]